MSDSHAPFDVLLYHPEFVRSMASGDVHACTELSDPIAAETDLSGAELIDMAGKAVNGMDIEGRKKQMEATFREKGMPEDHTVSVRTDTKTSGVERWVRVVFDVSWCIGQGIEEPNFHHAHAFILLGNGSPSLDHRDFEEELGRFLRQYHDFEGFPWEGDFNE